MLQFVNVSHNRIPAMGIGGHGVSLNIPDCTVIENMEGALILGWSRSPIWAAPNRNLSSARRTATKAPLAAIPPRVPIVARHTKRKQKIIGSTRDFVPKKPPLPPPHVSAPFTSHIPRLSEIRFQTARLCQCLDGLRALDKICV